LHVPFCSAICPYCDFAVTTGGAEERTRYASTLVGELGIREQDAELFGAFDTVYFGGGTPSALEPADLARVLDAARRHLAIADDAWISLEANPEDVDEARVREWKELGVRTVSLGVQSFDGDELRFLGRRHDPDEARRSVDVVLAAGFHTTSVDLIFGLPDQSRSALRRSLDSVISSGAQHVSCYQLTIHESTPFARRRDEGRLAELADQQQTVLYEMVHETLGGAAFLGYEVSNFARGGEHRSRHNDKYWRHTPYLGLGLSAHSFRARRRWWNEGDLTAYQARVDTGNRPVAGHEELGDGALALETVMLRLRTVEGIDLDDFRVRFGIDLHDLNRATIERLIEDDLARCDERTLRLTPRGFAVTDAVARALQVDQPED